MAKDDAADAAGSLSWLNVYFEERRFPNRRKVSGGSFRAVGKPPPRCARRTWLRLPRVAPTLAPPHDTFPHETRHVQARPPNPHVPGAVSDPVDDHLCAQRARAESQPGGARALRDP